ncbi:MAG: hypothetical protein JO161_05115, partial [Planctomycetaceae bacterium]|nr:hypothetical protein [Planctomycetaceae bacterium]
GPTPPGLVLSNAESPALAGAVALAAGRFQPLVRLAPLSLVGGSWGASWSVQTKRLDDLLSLAEARAFAQRIDALAGAVAGPHDRLGDACDFLTLAGDWPYRYANDAEGGIIRGEQAIDDLIGRLLQTDETSLAQSRSRWAFAGRLVGTPASCVYRAMCALFLQPTDMVLWNTYDTKGVQGWYRMTEAVRALQLIRPQASSPIHRAGEEASLAAWHQLFDPVRPFGLFMVNSSGGPRQFSIAGGVGYPADLPRGYPSAVAMIHSFSAACPNDPTTIAGRWLENGAFAYFGAINEPYLFAFRTPKLASELIAAEIPLSAALRQEEREPFGRPWRLVFLGDPLYHLRADDPSARERRMAPGQWPTLRSLNELSPVWEISAQSAPLAPAEDDAARLQWCRNMALAGLCHDENTFEKTGSMSRDAAAAVDWTPILTTIDRRQLEPGLRPVWDELLIDRLLSTGEESRLLQWLLQIRPQECSPRVWQTIESLAMRRLGGPDAHWSITFSLDLWEVLIRRPWLEDREFPAQLTERVSSLVSAAGGSARQMYCQRLEQLASELSATSIDDPRPGLLDAELRRLKAGSEGSWR